MSDITYLPADFRAACVDLSNRASGPMGANKTPIDWEKFFKMEHTTELVALGAGYAAVVYADSTKQVIQAASATPKPAVKVATTAALAASTLVGNVLTADANGLLGAIDGYTPIADDTILVQDQADAEENGVYVVTSVGAVGAAWVLTRRADFNADADAILGFAVEVENGTANGSKAFKLVTDAVTLGTTELVFEEVTADAATALFETHALLNPTSGLTLRAA